MSQIGRRKQILSALFLMLLIAALSCIYAMPLKHFQCSSTSESYPSFNFLDCSLLPGILIFEAGLFMPFSLIPLFFSLFAYLIPHLSEFIDSLFKPPQLAVYLS
jgi:hypothetical protein